MNYWKFQTALRLDNLTRYIANLKTSIANGELQDISRVENTLSRVIDVSLLGSGSERVSGEVSLLLGALPDVPRPMSVPTC